MLPHLGQYSIIFGTTPGHVMSWSELLEWWRHTLVPHQIGCHCNSWPYLPFQVIPAGDILHNICLGLVSSRPQRISLNSGWGQGLGGEQYDTGETNWQNKFLPGRRHLTIIMLNMLIYSKDWKAKIPVYPPSTTCLAKPFYITIFYVLWSSIF